MLKYYVIQPHVFLAEHWKKKLYTYNQLVKALANKEYEYLFEWLKYNESHSITFISLVYVQDKKPVYLEQDIVREEPLAFGNFKKLLKASLSWQKCEREQLLDYQYNYLKQANKFSTHQAILDCMPVLHGKGFYKSGVRHVPHTSADYKFSARSNKTPKGKIYKQYVYRRKLNNINYLTSEFDISPKYNRFKLRHINRQLDDYCYVWDDKKHMRTRHSTGWKYSSKNKYQYLARVKRQEKQNKHSKNSKNTR